jgi:flagellin
MVVQHNMQALNSNRQLGITTSAQAKSTEKLSSGYKINRAGDDAAGLAISEKMRSQFAALTELRPMHRTAFL